LVNDPAGPPGGYGYGYGYAVRLPGKTRPHLLEGAEARSRRAWPVAAQVSARQAQDPANKRIRPPSEPMTGADALDEEEGEDS
jgi:hypothetical protein